MYEAFLGGGRGKIEALIPSYLGRPDTHSKFISSRHLRFYLSKIREIGTFKLHNIYKRFTITVVSDLKKVFRNKCRPRINAALE